VEDAHRRQAGRDLLKRKVLPYPNVPFLFNLLMDPMEKMDLESKGWGYIGRKFFATKMWAPNAAVPFVAAHLKSLMECPPRQAADTLSIKKALDAVMKKLEDPSGANKEALADGRPESAIRSFNHTGCSCKQPATSQATEKNINEADGQVRSG